MEDQSGKKPFIIPKTRTSNKDVLINEKPDSRNVTDLFNDIRSCALEAQFDFRQNGCKSCDTIRNPKLQKLYNEKRLQMKKDHEVTERLAFHLITYRGVGINVATDGLTSDQLSLPIDKHLGNPKDGVHLSRRPDVLLTSSGSQGLYRFGLLVCKILLGKGYATIPSTANNQLPAQLHYDHHFCKNLSINKNQQQHIDDLLANSLVFCYEHENFQTISHPSQILPVAILWYDLIDRFSPELIPTFMHESQHRNGKITNGGKYNKKKTTNAIEKSESLVLNKPSISDSGAWEGPPQESPSEPSSTKYPSHFMIPFQRMYSTPSIMPSLTVDTGSQQQQQQQQINPTQQIVNSRDPRLLRMKRETTSNASETIPLSPQHLLNERSLSDGCASTTTTKSTRVLSDELVLITKSTSTIYIPLNCSTSLIDPRLKTLKPTRAIFYLELQAVKHALQQQKRLNHYYDRDSGLPPKTSYTLIPLLARQVSIDEYERLLNDDYNNYKITKHSNVKNPKSEQTYVDLEQSENQLAFEQIEISNQLIERQRQLNSQQIRLRLREKRQRRVQQQQQFNEKKIYDKQNFKSSSTINSFSSISKLHVAAGRQLLKEHRVSTMTTDKHLSPHVMDFLAREYQNENRSDVKYLLAELVGIFIEKYQINQQNGENKPSPSQSKISSLEEPVVNNQTMNVVIDMDLDSPSPSQELCDHDERFQEAPPPPPPSSAPSITESTNSLDDPDYQIRCQNLMGQLREYRLQQFQSIDPSPVTKSEPIISTEQLEPTSPEPSRTDENLPIDAPLSPPADQLDPNHSLDEFVKLLTKEAYVKKSPSPSRKPTTLKYTNKNSNNRRGSYNHSNSYRRYNRPLNKKAPLKKSSQKKISSNRTVLLTQRSTITDENQQNSHEEPKSKRLKTDSSTLSPTNSTNNLDDNIDLHPNDSGLKSIVTVSANIDDRHDCRHDLNEKRRIDASNRKSSRSRSDSRSRGDHHSDERRQRTSSQMKSHSRSSSSSTTTAFNDDSYRHSQTTRDNHQHQRSRHNRHQQILDRHELSIDHQRQSGPHKRFNYNHQSVTDHPRFSHNNVLPAMSTRDFDHLSSASRRPNHTSNMSFGDRSLTHSTNAYSARHYK